MKQSFVHPSKLVASVLPLLILAATLALPIQVRANMAMPQPAARPGDNMGEPSGGLKSIRIERERLLIDVRPLADGRPAMIEATYRVHNDADTHALELVFVAAALSPDEDGEWVWSGSKWARDPSAKRSFESGIWLDGQPVAGIRTETDAKELPPEWQPPINTPQVKEGDDAALPYQVTNSGTITFRVTITSGPHVIRVRYAARPSAYCGTDSDAVYWQLGYVLAPARRWAAFGGLDVNVMLPEGWRAASEPQMERRGDTLAGAWDKLPADTLALTFQTHERTYPNSEAYWGTLIIAGLVLAPLTALLGWIAGDKLGRRRRTSAWVLLLSPVAAALAVVIASFFAELAAQPAAPKQVAFNRVGGYDFLITFPLLVLIFFSSFIFMQVAAFAARMRAVKRIQ